jgi:hypothetical protein
LHVAYRYNNPAPKSDKSNNLGFFFRKLRFWAFFQPRNSRKLCLDPNFWRPLLCPGVWVALVCLRIAWGTTCCSFNFLNVLIYNPNLLFFKLSI